MALLRQCLIELRAAAGRPLSDLPAASNDRAPDHLQRLRALQDNASRAHLPFGNVARIGNPTSP